MYVGDPTDADIPCKQIGQRQKAGKGQAKPTSFPGVQAIAVTSSYLRTYSDKLMRNVPAHAWHRSSLVS